MQLKELRDQIRLLPPVLTGHDFWKVTRNVFRNWVLSFDPSQGSFRDCPAVAMTMETGNAEYIMQTELPRVSERVRSVVNKKEYGTYYGNMLHHAYHVCKFEDASKKDVSSFSSILEYGAGYGNTCELVHKLGFKGDYYICDFPEFGFLQKFYLEEQGIDTSKIVWNPPTTPDVDFFIAEWSLSETPHHERKHSGYEACAKNYLLAFQHTFKESDNHFKTVLNRDYFNGFKKENADMTWNEEVIEHLPNSSYLFGFQQ